MFCDTIDIRCALLTPLTTKHNNFDLVRLVLATTVVLVHIAVVSRQPELTFFLHLDSRGAVEGFFTISGFLIFASYDRCKSLREYFLKRARRILPAYWFSALLCIAIAVAFSHALHIGKFLVAYLTFLNFLVPGVPGVFSANPDVSAINSPTWTLKIEVAFYAIVPAVTWLCRRYGWNLVLGTIAILSIAFRIATDSNVHVSQQLPGQMCFFCAGALVYYHAGLFRRHGHWLLAPALVCYCAFPFTGWFILRILSVPVLVLGFCLLAPEIKGPTRWGDFSYGTYILHYPILQSLVALGFFRIAPYRTSIVAIVTVAFIATMSWFTVERRWLRREPARVPRHVEQDCELVVRARAEGV